MEDANGFVTNIEEETVRNNSFRRVIFTAENSQLVLMNLKPGEEIGMEVHEVDQFLRIEHGRGKAYLNGNEHEVMDGTAIVVPAGTEHNVVNSGEDNLQLYTVYSPPEHAPGTIHETKADADMAEEEEDDE